MTVDRDGNFFCPSCKKVHEAYPTERIKLVMSCSTLHQFFAPPPTAQLKQEYEGDAVHTDYVTIPGAKVEDLQQAFRVEYGKVKTGVDVLLVAGLNNVVEGDSMEDIMFKIQLFKETVAKQAWHHPDKPNTFAVATLLYPPQLCWFPDNGFLPDPHYVNRLDEMQWLNTQLMEFNESNGCLLVPHMHKIGVRIANRSNKDQYGQVSVRNRVFHRWGQWREEARYNMLHLNDEMRIYLGRTVNKYFRFNSK